MKSLLKQHNLGMWVGAIKCQAAGAQFYVGLVMLFMASVAATPTLQKWFPWLSFYMIMGILVFFFILAMYWDFVYVVPAQTMYLNDQYTKHKNPTYEDTQALRGDMEVLKRDNVRIESKIDALIWKLSQSGPEDNQ